MPPLPSRLLFGATDYRECKPPNTLEHDPRSVSARAGLTDALTGAEVAAGEPVPLGSLDVQVLHEASGCTND